MEDFVLVGIPASLLILALVNLAKEYLGLEPRYAPVLALGLGVVAGILAQIAGYDPVFSTWLRSILAGAIAGLSAVGLYSGVKNVLALDKD